ncbi:MAG: hypothetical protein BWY79_01956 [Actinobacteria bacterium ADurb.Bin444]|nr:MAG: hypothetical protein BWY79_01956 [Actinobacteria bacterium ADurb.Bin444]
MHPLDEPVVVTVVVPVTVPVAVSGPDASPVAIAVSLPVPVLMAFPVPVLLAVLEPVLVALVVPVAVLATVVIRRGRVVVAVNRGRGRSTDRRRRVVVLAPGVVPDVIETIEDLVSDVPHRERSQDLAKVPCVGPRRRRGE